MVIILSLSPFRIFTIYSKQQRLTILNRCTDWLCAQTVRHILTSFKMDEESESYEQIRTNQEHVVKESNQSVI